MDVTETPRGNGDPKEFRLAQGQKYQDHDAHEIETMISDISTFFQ